MACSLAETIKTNFLNCAICFELYRDPRALPCQHSFCRKCLEQCVASSEDKQTLVCPTCRRKVHISTDGVKDLPVHFLVSSLKDTVDMEQQAQLPNADTTCSNCNASGNKAKVRCMDCRKYLCETCHSYHRTFEVMKGHRIINMGDILSGKLSLSAEIENICKEHKEPYKYYCKDEKKAICQDCVILKKCLTDHDRITIDEAAQKKSDELEGLVKKSDETLKKYQEALKATKDVEKVLEIQSQIAKDRLAKVEQEYINLVKKTVKRFEDEIDKIKEERSKELNNKMTNLKSTMKNIEKAKKGAANVIKSESKMSILSSHANLSTQLQKLTRSHPDKADKALGYVRFEAAIPAIPTIGKVVKDESTVQQWLLIEEFSTRDFKKLSGLAINHDGDIGITSYNNGVRVFTRSGETKYIFTDCPDNVRSIAVTPDNKYVVDGYKEILIYDSQGNKNAKIPVYDMQGELSYANYVAVDSSGKIILVQVANTISIHNADGSLISKFAKQSKPFCLATTSNGEFVSSIWDPELKRGKSVQLMDYSGGNVRVIQPPTGVTVWVPEFVCCRQGEILVSNQWAGKPCGVYRYTSEGDYLGCVTTEIRIPSGIALSKDGMELFIADYGGHVRIFQCP